MSQSTAGAQEAGDDEEVEFHGPDVRPGYPDAFHLSYTLRKDAVSPDGTYGVLFPDRTHMDDPANFIVAVKESRLVGMIDFEPEHIYFAGSNHGGLSVCWAPNSSTVLVVSEGKWSPRELMLIELKDGRINRQTPLLGLFEKAIVSAAPKAFRQGTSMVEMDLNDISWKTEKLLQIKGELTTNPKAFPNENSWSGTIAASWDTALCKFTQVKVKQTSFTKAETEEE